MRHGEAERLGGSEVVYKLELDRLKYRQVSGFSPHEGMIRLGELGRQPVIGLSYRGNNLCTMELRRRQFLHLGGAAALAPLSRYAYAQGWPTRSVRLIVGFAPDNGLNSVAHISPIACRRFGTSRSSSRTNLAMISELGLMQSLTPRLMAIRY